jgi:catalase
MPMWAIPDRAISLSDHLRQSFDVHTFCPVNAFNKSMFCKIHWKPLSGIDLFIGRG